MDHENYKQLTEKFQDELEQKLLLRATLVNTRDKAKKNYMDRDTDVKMIEEELKQFLIDSGRDLEPVYSSGLRLAFRPKYTATVVPGTEHQLLDWAKQNNCPSLIKLSISTRALSQCMTDCIQLPAYLNCNDFNEFKITKDTRKGGGTQT